MYALLDSMQGMFKAHETSTTSQTVEETVKPSCVSMVSSLRSLPPSSQTASFNPPKHNRQASPLGEPFTLLEPESDQKPMTTQDPIPRPLPSLLSSPDHNKENICINTPKPHV